MSGGFTLFQPVCENVFVNYSPPPVCKSLVKHHSSSAFFWVKIKTSWKPPSQKWRPQIIPNTPKFTKSWSDPCLSELKKWIVKKKHQTKCILLMDCPSCTALCGFFSTWGGWVRCDLGYIQLISCHAEILSIRPQNDKDGFSFWRLLTPTSSSNPKGTMYGTLTYTFHKSKRNVGKYTMDPMGHWFTVSKTHKTKGLSSPKQSGTQHERWCWGTIAMAKGLELALVLRGKIRPHSKQDMILGYLHTWQTQYEHMRVIQDNETPHLRCFSNL